MRPVVLVTGDPQQSQSFENKGGKTEQVPNVFSDKNFYSLVDSYTLKRQYRVIDEKYDKFLKYIRFWKPSQALLDSVQDGRIICDNETPSEEELSRIPDTYPDATVLTFTRKATYRINKIYIKKIFAEAVPLATVQCDDEMEPCAIYHGMKVVITQNRNKSLNVVNGQLATVQCVRNATIFLKLSNEEVVSIYPVTYLDKEGKNCICYPFMPCYALTVAKAIGLTLQKIILWLDITNIPLASAMLLYREYENQKI